MRTEKILEVVALYRMQLEAADIAKVRMDPSKTGADLTQIQMLEHAHWLLDGIIEYAQDSTKVGKTGRHLASVQMFLLFAGWFTLNELMEHNRPDSTPRRTHEDFFKNPYKHHSSD